MYYSKQSSTKVDYYNTYNNNSNQYNNGESYLVLTLKMLLIVLLIGLLFVGYLFISDKNNFKSKISMATDKPAPFQISQDLSENKNISIKKIEIGENGMSQEEMALVVELVISQMNKEKEREKEELDDELYTKKLITQDVDGLWSNSENIDLKKFNIEQIVKQTIALKNVDHYNKIIINKPTDDKYTNDRLTKLSNELSFVIDDDFLDKNSSSYTDEITKEVAVRSNEMRIIIVQKGDTLSKIAKRAYHNEEDYKKIFKANPEVIKNPNQIFVGQRLRIPI